MYINIYIYIVVYIYIYMPALQGCANILPALHGNIYIYIYYEGVVVRSNSAVHHREISSGELNKTQLNFHHREILVARRVVLIKLL